VASNLTKRILFAIPAAAVVLAATWAGGVFLQALLILILGVLVHEVIPISEKCDLPVNQPFTYLGSFLILLIPEWQMAQFMGIVWFLGLIIAELRSNDKQRQLLKLVSTPFWALYTGIGLRALLDIRMQPTGGDLSGVVLTIALFLMVWGNDVFAYFAGKSLGKHKLAPMISPNKTWEGFAGGIVGAYAGLLIIYSIYPQSFPLELFWLLPLPLLISIIGPVGDLTQSKFKRVAGVKDSSNLLPGHGGMFDRMDALMVSAPTMFVYLELVYQLVG
jgi:phosphatidate cytidylyltransferase